MIKLQNILFYFREYSDSDGSPGRSNSTFSNRSESTNSDRSQSTYSNRSESTLTDRSRTLSEVRTGKNSDSTFRSKSTQSKILPRIQLNSRAHSTSVLRHSSTHVQRHSISVQQSREMPRNPCGIVNNPWSSLFGLFYSSEEEPEAMSDNQLLTSEPNQLLTSEANARRSEDGATLSVSPVR